MQTEKFGSRYKVWLINVFKELMGSQYRGVEVYIKERCKIERRCKRRKCKRKKVSVRES